MLDERRLRRALEVGQTVVSELDLEVVLRRVLDMARDLTGARYAALGILDRDRKSVERFLTAGIDPAAHEAIGDPPQGRGVLGLLIADPRPLRLDDVSRHPKAYGFPPNHPPMRAFLGVPVLVRGEAYGNLYLTEKRGGAAFDEADEEAIVLLATWAGIAIGNARAYTEEQERRAELERAVRALEATTAIARAVGGETDLDRVLELIAKRARALVDARDLVIVLREGDEMTVRAVAGEMGKELLGTRLPAEGSISGHVLRTRRPQRLAQFSSVLRRALGDAGAARTGLFVPLIFRGRPLGVLSAYDRAGGQEFTVESERLLESFAASAATAVATAQTVAAEGLRRSIDASERERQRWARELHDETLQQLAGLKVLLSGARRSEDPAAVREALATAIVQLDDGITELRRLIADLRPAALDEFGTKVALEGLIERVAETSGLAIDLRVDLDFDEGRSAERHPAELENATYRIVQEALTNVVKHSGATRVQVTVIEREGRIEVTVRDDGRGFDVEAPGEGFGLIGMRERLELVNGSFHIESTPGGGTTLTATLPVADWRPPAAASVGAGGAR